MIKIKVFKDVFADQDAINKFIQSVDVVDKGIAHKQDGAVIITYLEKDNRPKAEKDAEEDAKEIAAMKESEVPKPIYSYKILGEMLNKSTHEVVQRKLELAVCKKIEKKNTGNDAQKVFNAQKTADAERQVEAAQYQVHSIKEVMAELDAGTLVF